MGINNCSTCTHHSQLKPADGHCYMFQAEPKEICYQHTATKVRTVFVPSPVGLIPMTLKDLRLKSEEVDLRKDNAGLRIRLANASQLQGSVYLSGLCHAAWERIKELEASIAKNEAPKPPPRDEPASVDMVVTPQNTTPPNDGLPDLDYRGIWAQCLKIASEDMRTLCAPPLGPAEKRRYKNQLNERALKEFGLRVIL